MDMQGSTNHICKIDPKVHQLLQEMVPIGDSVSFREETWINEFLIVYNNELSAVHLLVWWV